MKRNFTGNGFVKDLLGSFRSDDLVALRSILAQFQPQVLAYNLPPRLYLVPDANCILKDLDFLCRRRRNPVRSALEEVIDAGLVRLFAPLELDEEVQRHIPTIAANGKADAAAYFAEWDRFKKKVRFFHACDGAPVEITDPNDACYIRASRIIGAEAVVTDDVVVINSTTSIRPPVIHHQLLQVSRDEAVKWGVSVQGALLTLLTGKVLKVLATNIYRKPQIGVPIAAVLGLLGFLYDRNAVKKTGTSFLRELFGEIVSGILAIATEVKERSESNVNRLAAVGVFKGKTESRPLEKIVHAILIHEAKPISETDIVKFAQIEGFNPWTACPQLSGEKQAQWVERAWAELSTRVASILRSDSVFCWTGTGWTTRLLFPRPTERAMDPAIRPNELPTNLPSGAEPISKLDTKALSTELIFTEAGGLNAPVSPPKIRRPAAPQPRQTKKKMRSLAASVRKKTDMKKAGKKGQAKKPKTLPKTVRYPRPRVKARHPSKKA